MSVQFDELLNLIDDHVSGKTGNIDIDKKKRQANESIRYFQRKVGLPSDEKIFQFDFCSDQIYYDGPTDFQEEMQLVYDDENQNLIGNEWEFRPYSELLVRTASKRGRWWSVTPINGSWQVMMLGPNLYSGTTVESFDAVGDWVASGDASGLAQDLLQVKVGDGSVSFDITNSSGTAKIYNDQLSLDVKSLFENHGHFKMWNFMTDANIDSVAIKLFVDNANYWTISTTTDDAGVDFSADKWMKLDWPLDNALKTGTPSIEDVITKVQLEWDLGAGFTSAVDFRVDQLFTVVPDKMDLIYRSNYIGTNHAGTVNKTNLSSGDDLIAIGNLLPDVVDIIARRAALTLWPGLRGDKDFMQIYKSELSEFTTDHARRWPRTRTNKYKRTTLRR